MIFAIDTCYPIYLRDHYKGEKKAPMVETTGRRISSYDGGGYTRDGISDRAGFQNKEPTTYHFNEMPEMDVDGFIA